MNSRPLEGRSLLVRTGVRAAARDPSLCGGRWGRCWRRKRVCALKPMNEMTVNKLSGCELVSQTQILRVCFGRQFSNTQFFWQRRKKLSEGTASLKGKKE